MKGQKAMDNRPKVCQAEEDYGDSGRSCQRPEGHEGLHYDFLRGWWQHDANPDDRPHDYIEVRWGQTKAESERTE